MQLRYPTLKFVEKNVLLFPDQQIIYWLILVMNINIGNNIFELRVEN